MCVQAVRVGAVRGDRMCVCVCVDAVGLQDVCLDAMCEVWMCEKAVCMDAVCAC